MEGSVAPVAAGDIVADKYVVERVLGHGGMGVVVAARHSTLNQRVALKFLLPEACRHPGAIERFLREARAAVQIQSEHVARVTDVGTLETGAPYMVMEFLEGHDLAREIELEGPLAPAVIAAYVLQACEAIAEAHALTIVHRDLKPPNLFLSVRKDGSRVVKVLDFGISKAVQDAEANLTQTASMMGSPLYMAPEQIRNAKAVDARADVWSLGVILHEALTGTVPFDGETLPGVLAAIVADEPRPLATLCPDLPDGLTAIVARCLEKDPNRRVQDVGELAELLAPFAPAQAAQSLPRIRSLLGRAPGAVGRSAQASIATQGTVVANTADGDRTVRPWVTAESAEKGGRKSFLVPALVVGGLAIAGIVGALVWSSAATGGDEELPNAALPDGEPPATSAATQPSDVTQPPAPQPQQPAPTTELREPDAGAPEAKPAEAALQAGDDSAPSAQPPSPEQPRVDPPPKKLTSPPRPPVSKASPTSAPAKGPAPSIDPLDGRR